MEIREKWTGWHHKFCLAEGNQHVASEYTIHKLQELISKFNMVQEVGLGLEA